MIYSIGGKVNTFFSNSLLSAQIFLIYAPVCRGLSRPNLLYQSIPHSHTLLHDLSIDGVAVCGVVGEAGEGFGEGAECGDGLRDGFQWGRRDAVEAALCKQCPGDDGLSRGGNVLVERCQLVAGFNAIVVGEDEAVVEVVVYR